MGTRITITQRDELKYLSKVLNKPLTELIEMAVSSVLDGSTPLPIKDVGQKVEISVYLPYAKEQALKVLSKKTEVSLEEIYRVAIRSLLESGQSMIDKANNLARVQEAQIKRKEMPIVRDEALMRQREILMENDLNEYPNNYEAPRSYSGHRKKT